ncbi:hypothetical protein Acsp06_60470 [Actinomycetospora sp. NBRC 106375]|uniref:FmdB family zinc ribbon protein n=1 Tax=Actinomycetospora sp. NBRC 106375 TaxID=3032207 RepID=UPI0024A1948B|nr:zinc ribbon domain-containing protein [Actinomycetospora sp. NBRC 106375]GLZ49862.1 hypothetical protein Acsp06_60470 [Actinomycetospora sp. NBRC 106375]
MPLYDYACVCGERFEVLMPSWRSANPYCPTCGEVTTRRPAAPALKGMTSPPPPMSAAPHSWEGVDRGNRELLTRWRHALDRRQEFESVHPEHAERRDAVAAHEGIFENSPLTYREIATRAETHRDTREAVTEAGRSRLATHDQE